MELCVFFSVLSRARGDLARGLDRPHRLAPRERLQPLEGRPRTRDPEGDVNDAASVATRVLRHLRNDLVECLERQGDRTLPGGDQPTRIALPCRAAGGLSPGEVARPLSAFEALEPYAALLPDSE